MVEQESIMKGPGSFPGETLLAIFQCIASVGDSSFGEKEDEEGQEEANGYGKESKNMRLLSRKCLEADDSMFQTVGDQN